MTSSEMRKRETDRWLAEAVMKKRQIRTDTAARRSRDLLRGV